MKRLLLLLFVFFSFASAALAAPVHIRDFQALVEVEGDGGIVVQEKLLVEIPRSGEFRGIFRDIPVVTRWRESGIARMEVLSVMLDGRARPADDVRKEDGFVRIYQRDKDRILQPGLHEFVLTYRMTGQIGLFQPNDELTWNVTGSGWEAPIDKASCVMLCPKGAPRYGQAAWLGRLGSRDSAVAMSQSERNGRVVMSFKARRTVMPGEQLTVAAGWGKGFVRVEDERQGMTTILLGALALALFLYFCVTWHFFGRDPQKGVVIPRFYPPMTKRGQVDGKPGRMSPAAVGYLAHQALFSPSCFGAALISLSGRGCCRIEGNAREGFTMARGEGESPCVEENSLLRFLPSEAVRIDKAHGELLHDMRQALQVRLRREYGKMWKGGRGSLLNGLFGSVWTFLGMAAALIGLAAVLGWSCGGVLPPEMMAAPMGVLFCSFFARNLAKIVANDWKRRKKARAVFVAFFFGAFFSVFVGALFYGTAKNVLIWFSPLQLALMAAVLLVPFGFSFIMDAPSVEARALLDEIEGFAMYIGTAESGRLNAMNPPEQTLKHYQEVLPYAVALELEDAWGARFASVLDSQTASEQAAGHTFWNVANASALSSCASASAASHAASEAASSQSSFGGGGGGGAGSGGGGGGGGGC